MLVALVSCRVGASDFDHACGAMIRVSSDFLLQLLLLLLSASTVEEESKSG